MAWRSVRCSGRALALAALVAAVAPAGCMRKARNAEYDQGITFVGWHGTSYEIVEWSCDQNQPQPCPLVIHHPDGDLDANALADRKALTALGWSAQDQGNGRTQISHRHEGLLLWADHQGGVLVRVGVNALTCEGPQEEIISVGGKRLP